MLYTYLVLETLKNSTTTHCDVSNCPKFLDEYETSNCSLNPSIRNEDEPAVCMTETDFHEDEYLIKHVKKVLEDPEECPKENCEEIDMMEEDECSSEECRLVNAPIPISRPGIKLIQPRTVSRCSIDLKGGRLGPSRFRVNSSKFELLLHFNNNSLKNLPKIIFFFKNTIFRIFLEPLVPIKKKFKKTLPGP